MAANTVVADADPAFKKLVELFVAELGERAEALRAALASDDRPTVRRIAHQLKGAAGGYGFAELGMLAALVEHDCQDEAPADQLTASVERLTDGCEAARQSTNVDR